VRDRPLLESVEFAVNPEPRCPCVLLLDTSGSMEGDRIDALNDGLRAFRRQLVGDGLAARRVEVAIVTFDSHVRVAQPFVTVDRFTPPTLTASGGTRMGGGIEAALTLLEARKSLYKSNGIAYYRPWIVLITDGKPEGESPAAVERARRRLRDAERRKRAMLFAVAVEGADVHALRGFTDGDLYELDGMEFRELFVWLSTSMQVVSHSADSETVALPPIRWVSRIRRFISENEQIIRESALVVRLLVKVATGV
jgi:uncharacterized protein YegL